MKILRWLIIIIFCLSAASVFAQSWPTPHRSWINVKRDMQGVADYSSNLTSARLDSIAQYYDWVIFGAGEGSGMYNDPRADSLYERNANIILITYLDGAYADARAGHYFQLYSDSFGVNVDSCYLHFSKDAVYPNAGMSTAHEDKFGSPEVSTDSFYTKQIAITDTDYYVGRGVFVYDASAGWQTGCTASATSNRAFTGTTQTFCVDEGDCLYLGQVGIFREAIFDLSTMASANWAGTWEYLDTASGGTWTALTVTSDGTADMTQDGTVVWTTPGEKKWQHWYPSDEHFTNHWVRLRCTAAGTTAPAYVTVKGEKFIDGSGTFKGWDEGNDADGDGVWDNNHNSNATAMFKWWSRVVSAWYGEYRRFAGFYNKFSPAFTKMMKIYVYNYVHTTGSNGVYFDDYLWHEYDGQIWDGGPQWSNFETLDTMSDGDEADSLWIRAAIDGQADACRDTLVAGHTVGAIDTIVGANICEPDLMRQYYNSGYSSSGPLHNLDVEFWNDLRNLRPTSANMGIDRLKKAFVSAARGQTVTLTHYYSSTQWAEKPRWDNFALAYHYLIEGERIFFGILEHANFTQLGWVPAIDYDMGSPQSENNYLDTSDVPWTLWSVQSGDSIYYRDYINCGSNNDSSALVLVRFKNSSSTDSTTADTIALTDVYYRLYADGTLASPLNKGVGTPNDSVTLLANDGAILVKAGGPCVVTHSLSYASLEQTSVIAIDAYTSEAIDSLNVVWDTNSVITDIIGSVSKKSGFGSPDSLSITGLAAGTTHWFWFVLYQGGCNSDTSNASTFTTESVEPPATKYLLKTRRN